MTPVPLPELRSWISEVSGADSVDELGSVWAAFAGHGPPVATLFGAFDTGKSSILRRLLVDTVQPVPDWLTISARHETFAETIVEVAGCLVRDTPGLSPGGQDARSISNSKVARSALGLTDVLLVTLNPQLATGERQELIDILSQGWPPACVWFLISRSDEGGVDPQADQLGFQAWAAQKRDELRASLSLPDTSRIFVIVPDYAGLGAFEPEPEPSLWDSSRPWDGMDHLRAALVDLSGADLTASRSAAEQRFWQSAVRERLTDVRSQLETFTVSRNVAVTSQKRRNLLLKRMDSLADAAKASLEGAVEDAIRRALNSPQLDKDSIEKTVDPVLEEWWQRQQIGLARIRQEAIQALDHQRQGPGWAKLESLYRTFAQPDAADTHGEPRFAPGLERLGQKVAAGLKGVDGIWRTHQAAKYPARATELLKSTSKFGLAAGISIAVLPLAVELASVIEDKVQTERDKERQRVLRQQIENEVGRIVKEGAARAMKDLASAIEALRQEISEHTVGQAEVGDLEAAVAQASEIVSRGETLLST